MTARDVGVRALEHYRAFHKRVTLVAVDADEPAGRWITEVIKEW
jgi:hypothetical protein